MLQKLGTNRVILHFDERVLAGGGNGKKIGKTEI